MREAMEMFNEKVDLGLFVNNDIQPNVQMIGGKRSETPTVEKQVEKPKQEEASTVAVVDDAQDHEITKKSDISKAKARDFSASSSMAAVKKDNILSEPTPASAPRTQSARRGGSPIAARHDHMPRREGVTSVSD